MRDDDQHTEDQWQWHMRAIRQVHERWQSGELTTWAKRSAIAAENRRYYDGVPPPGLAATGPRYDLPRVLAEGLGIDTDVMVTALNMYRQSGRQAYQDVLAAALGRPLNPRRTP